jgi:hypothetical protein
MTTKQNVSGRAWSVRAGGEPNAATGTDREERIRHQRVVGPLTTARLLLGGKGAAVVRRRHTRRLVASTACDTRRTMADNFDHSRYLREQRAEHIRGGRAHSEMKASMTPEALAAFEAWERRPAPPKIYWWSAPSRIPEKLGQAALPRGRDFGQRVFVFLAAVAAGVLVLELLPLPVWAVGIIMIVSAIPARRWLGRGGRAGVILLAYALAGGLIAGGALGAWVLFAGLMLVLGVWWWAERM